MRNSHTTHSISIKVISINNKIALNWQLFGAATQLTSTEFICVEQNQLNQYLSTVAIFEGYMAIKTLSSWPLILQPGQNE